MIGARNIKGGLVLVALSLLGGLAMSLYAFVPMIRVPPSLDQYDDLTRRLLRLAHIAAVMLPVLNIVFGLMVDRVRMSRGWKELTSLLLLFGALALPLGLGTEALHVPARDWHLAAPGAIAFTLGTVVLAVGACLTSSDDFQSTPRPR